MDDLDRGAEWLDRLFGDPMQDAVPAVAHVVAVSEATGRRRYQTCRLELVIEAVGVETIMMHTEAVVSRDHWPREGMTLPAQVSRSRPDLVEVDWDALGR